MSETATDVRGKWLPEEVSDVLPCPFCGQPPKIEASYVETGGGDGAFSYRIGCDNHYGWLTAAAGRLGRLGYTRHDDPPTESGVRAEVKAAWNARPS